MKAWIGKKLSEWSLTLTGWSHAIRGIKPTEPKPLSDYAQTMSDEALIMVHRTPVSDALKSEMAFGLIDGASRFLDGEPAKQEAAE